MVNISWSEETWFIVFWFEMINHLWVVLVLFYIFFSKISSWSRSNLGLITALFRHRSWLGWNNLYFVYLVVLNVMMIFINKLGMIIVQETLVIYCGVMFGFCLVIAFEIASFDCCISFASWRSNRWKFYSSRSILSICLFNFVLLSTHWYL